MKKFTVVKSIAVPLDRADVDTDQIIPKQFLRSIQKSGYGPYLFDEWRYLDKGDLGMDCSLRPLNPDFVLNHYSDAKILLARENFGCGSSREHAVWALSDYGFEAVIAPSFSDIFYSNAIKNGLLPALLTAIDMEELFCEQLGAGASQLTVDLVQQTVSVAGGRVFAFHIADDEKKRLLEGQDDISLTLQRKDEICRYEEWRQRLEPWVFDEQPPESK